MIREEITQSLHALQVAYISLSCKAPKEFVIGLLYHDVGQISEMNKVGNTNYLHKYHDDIGYKWMNDRGFPELSCQIVQYHTLAKIVICGRNKDYYHNLLEASQISYTFKKINMNQKNSRKSIKNS